jgi:hypothetical protein
VSRVIVVHVLAAVDCAIVCVPTKIGGFIPYMSAWNTFASHQADVSKVPGVGAVRVGIGRLATVAASQYAKFVASNFDELS